MSFKLVAYNFYREFFLYAVLQYVASDFCMDNNDIQSAKITQIKNFHKYSRKNQAAKNHKIKREEHQS